VFIHGCMTPSSTPYPHDCLGLPVSEVRAFVYTLPHSLVRPLSITQVPNETFKAAAHLVVTGKKRKYPNVKIILAHLGGSAPFLAPRVAVLSNHMGCVLTPEDILKDFKTFYFETALSAHKTTLDMMERFVGPQRLLFGSDFPGTSIGDSRWFDILMVAGPQRSVNK
jgi:6-methylsalicylate decarboxylase